VCALEVGVVGWPVVFHLIVGAWKSCNDLMCAL
jgi:hypothetical protein